MPFSPIEIVRQCSIAIISVAAVFGLTMLLTRFVQADVSLIYLVAVMYASWRGGIIAGLLSTVLSVALAAYFFLSPLYTFTIEEGLVELVVFALAAVLVSSIGAGLERALTLEKAARVEAEAADRVKDEFLATVSHELRTPLTTIKALTRLLMREELAEEKRGEYLETIAVECDRQIDLVLNLLELSRIEGGVFRVAMQKVDIASVVRSCIKAETRAAERRMHKIEILSEGVVPAACADPKALRRVLSNVIENAIKYTPDGGSISIATSYDDDRVSIGVTDNGRGIPAEDLPVLFDKFHRGRSSQNSAVMRNATEAAEFLEDADVSGVGLGLYLGKTVMEQMRGSITVETAAGRGSTFTLCLPIWNDDTCGNLIDEEAENG